MKTAPAHAASTLPEPVGLTSIYRLRSAATVGPLPAVVLRMIRLFDGKRTLASVCHEAQISEAKGEAIVRKLSQLRILETVSDSAGEASLSGFERCETLRGLPPLRSPALSPLRSSDFSAAEEAFFASEVAPIDECDEPFESLGEKVSSFFSEVFLRVRGAAL